MSVDGTPKFGTIAVKEITADITQNNTTLTAKAAFVDRTTGNTHGWTQGGGAVWSRETVEILHALQASMEQDLARLHFQEGGTVVTGQRAPTQMLGGIGEHLEEADQA